MTHLFNNKKLRSFTANSVTSYEPVVEGRAIIQSLSATKYRSEIDGLRAVAVLPVLYAHAGLPGLSGGFLGVDVFFVISGFLITGIIISELDDGKFSLLNFYERRARRILPALSLVVLACFPMAWLLMLPDPLENFGQSAFATMLSGNNILLTQTSGYWDLASEFKPLLHTWSLAVEEQFYIAFPMLLVAIWPRLRIRAAWVVALITAASLIAAILLSPRYPSASFYLLHTRAWELGVGVLGAFYEHRRKVEGRDTLAALGLAAIILSMVLFTPETVHPSLWTVLPVMGTLLVLLFARRGGRIAGYLALRPFVFVGLISYSLYLWHQPVYAFARIASFEEPAPFTFVMLAAFSFLLAVLSWRFIEQPFRKKSRLTRGNVFLATGAMTAGLASLGLAMHFGQGFPGRLFIEDGSNNAGMNISYNERIRQYSTLQFPSEAAGPKLLIIGNSQARDFANVLMELGLLENKAFVYNDGTNICNYPQFDEGLRNLIDEADVIFYPILELTPACESFVKSGQARTLNVVFVGPKHFGYNLNAFIQMPLERRSKAHVRIFEEVRRANAMNLAKLPVEHYIDLIAAISHDGVQVRVFDDAGQIISADRVHITQAGARFMGRRLRDHPALAILRDETLLRIEGQ